MMDELNKFCKMQIKLRNEHKIWNTFYDICFENDNNKLENYIMENNGDYKSIFKLEIKYDSDGSGILIKLYEKSCHDVLDYILDLEWKNELFINNLLARFVEHSNHHRLKKLTNKSLYCLGACDIDLYNHCCESTRNPKIIDWLDNYFAAYWPEYIY